MSCVASHGVVFCQFSPEGFVALMLLLVVTGYAIARISDVAAEVLLS